MTHGAPLHTCRAFSTAVQKCTKTTGLKVLVSTCSVHGGPILLFDPRREHSFVPIAHSSRRRAAGTIKAGRIFAATRRAWP